MPTITVTTASDVVNANDGVTSLREAITQSNAASDTDTIVFAASLDGASITLQSGPLVVSGSFFAGNTVTIDGDIDNDGIADITIDGAGASYHFQIDPQATATLDGIVLTGGYANGQLSGNVAVGSIRNSGRLTIVNSRFEDNTAIGFTGNPAANANTGGQSGGMAVGAIMNYGELTVSGTSFASNVATGGDAGRGFNGVDNTSPADGTSGGIGGSAVGGIANMSNSIVALTDVVFTGQIAVGGQGGSGGNAGDSAASPYATGGNGYGGGDAAGGVLNVSSGQLTLANVSFVNQTAEAGDGGEGGQGGTIANGQAPGGNGGGAGHASLGILNYGSVSGGASASGGAGRAGVAGDGGAGGFLSTPAVFDDPGRAGANGAFDRLLLSLGEVAGDNHAGIAGSESYFGRTGNDNITAGPIGDGDDRIEGEAGNDTLTGDGSDTLRGGDGNDRIVVRAVGNGLFAGGSGTDTLDLSLDPVGVTGVYRLSDLTFTTSAGGTFSGFEHVVGSVQGEQIVGASGVANNIQGGGGNDTLEGAASDTLMGGAGDDLLSNVATSGGLHDGGVGSDTIDFQNNATIAGTYDLSLAVGFSLNGCTFLNFEHVIGSQQAETMIGTAGANILQGRDGNDTLNGGSGNDTLSGGGGTDTLNGGADNDTYVNPTGDTIAESAGGGLDTVTSDVTFSIEALAQIERLFLTGANAIDGTGNALGNQFIGNDKANTLNGRDGNDTINGGGGADTLNGGSGLDRLIGGLQRDKIIPGTDNVRDEIVFTLIGESTGVTRDVITGLDLNNEDRIDLPGSVAAIAAARSGTLSLATFNANLASVLNAAALPANTAALFTPTSGDLDQPGMVYLIVDANGLAGYQANQDWVFQLENHTGGLDTTDFI